MSSPSLSPQHSWKHLSRQQVGAYAEYFVKMQLTLKGFEVYSSEIDDRGIDFVARLRPAPFIEIQVKSIRKSGYVFMQKSKFPLNSDRYLALVIFNEASAPEISIIPASRWTTRDQLFVSRDYEGLKSVPEWGLNLSARNLPLLKEFSVESFVSSLVS